MNNNSIKEKSNVSSKHTTIAFALIMVCFFSCMRASEHIIATADMLTKASYTSPQIEEVLVLFTDEQMQSFQSKNFPTAKDIIKKVAQLEKSQNFLKNFSIKKKSIDALQATIHATEKAISIAYAHKNNKNGDSMLLEAIHNEVVTVLQEQKESLQKKMNQLNTTSSINTFFSNPANQYMIAGTILGMLATGIGISYYFNLFDHATSIPKDPIVFSGPFDEKRNALYTKMSVILNNFVDPNDKQSTSIYLNEAKNIITELDPVNDAPIIEMLTTFIESQKRLESGIFNKNFFDNACFWKETHDKRFYYTQILTQILNHNANGKKVFIPDDLDIRELLSQKNQYNPTA